MRGLPDIIALNPRVMFVGINPSLRSAEVGHHFGGRGNPFWRILHTAGLTPILLTYEEDWRLAEFGMALTNLCPRPSREAAELTAAEIEAGKRALLRKIRRLRPRLVALVGVSIYRRMFPASQSTGAGLKPETIAGARVFVLPNPSGRNAAFPGFEDKVVWFRRLTEILESETPVRNDRPT
jgi:double-stranded uracil-DNA glycosylase